MTPHARSSLAKLPVAALTFLSCLWSATGLVRTYGNVEQADPEEVEERASADIWENLRVATSAVLATDNEQEPCGDCSSCPPCAIGTTDAALNVAAAAREYDAALNVTLTAEQKAVEQASIASYTRASAEKHLEELSAELAQANLAVGMAAATEQQAVGMVIRGLANSQLAEQQRRMQEQQKAMEDWTEQYAQQRDDDEKAAERDREAKVAEKEVVRLKAALKDAEGLQAAATAAAANAASSSAEAATAAAASSRASSRAATAAINGAAPPTADITITATDVLSPCACGLVLGAPCASPCASGVVAPCAQPCTAGVVTPCNCSDA